VAVPDAAAAERREVPRPEHSSVAEDVAKFFGVASGG
jgi:hypothetical protein